MKMWLGACVEVEVDGNRYELGKDVERVKDVVVVRGRVGIGSEENISTVGPRQ